MEAGHPKVFSSKSLGLSCCQSRGTETPRLIDSSSRVGAASWTLHCGSLVLAQIVRPPANCQFSQVALIGQLLLISGVCLYVGKTAAPKFTLVGGAGPGLMDSPRAQLTSTFLVLTARLTARPSHYEAGSRVTRRSCAHRLCYPLSRWARIGQTLQAPQCQRQRLDPAGAGLQLLQV